ncbi:Uncharacterized protein HZ326_7576 [Fusarium oxysporum f. sp. albedinis]|nr:Uncharacterized protein HZ326_7576 [Fusarium oxysporum f. sp. albedinis]
MMSEEPSQSRGLGRISRLAQSCRNEEQPIHSASPTFKTFDPVLAYEAYENDATLINQSPALGSGCLQIMSWLDWYNSVQFAWPGLLSFQCASPTRQLPNFGSVSGTRVSRSTGRAHIDCTNYVDPRF